MKKIILASASPRRKEILQRSGIEFSVIPSLGEEITAKTEPWEVVEDLSRAKAMSVLDKAGKGSLVIGADTVVAFKGKILGKPFNEEDAVKTLMMLQGNTHQVYTGVTVLYGKDGKWIPLTFHECTDVTFYPIDEEEIMQYVNSGEGMDKAGSYGIQGYFGSYVEKISGDYNNVVGLPAARLIYELKQLGIDIRG